MKRSKNKRKKQAEKITWKEVVMALLAIAVMGLFGFVAIDKFWLMDKFREGLDNASVIPDSWAFWIAWGVPVTCLAIAAFILAGFWFAKLLTTGIYAAAVFMLLFTGFIAYVIQLPLEDQPCYCIGLDTEMAWETHLNINLSILTVIGLAVWLNHRIKKDLVATKGANAGSSLNGEGMLLTN